MQAFAVLDFPPTARFAPPAPPSPPRAVAQVPPPAPVAPPSRPAPPLGTPRVLVTIATYNERDNLAPLIQGVHRELPFADILVIDDNSPDGTGKLADELAAKDDRVKVLHRPGKLGLGTATFAAMRYAIDSDYDLMQNMDADFSHPTRFLKGIQAQMNAGNDVVVGSRYAKGGGTENWPLARLAISRAVNGLVRFLYRMPVKDASGAFRCYRVSLLKKAQLERTQSRGYSFQQEVLFRCHLAGAKMAEHPIIFENRRAGKSKVNSKEAARSIATILWLGTTHFFGLTDYRKG